MQRAASPGALACLVALAACSSPTAVPDVAEGDERIACALAGAKEFKPVCAVERDRSKGALTLVVRHPDGGFRRFDVLEDGRGLAVADGATQGVARFADGMAELAVGEDRYRFPVTIRKSTQEKGTAGADAKVR